MVCPTDAGTLVLAGIASGKTRNGHPGIFSNIFNLRAVSTFTRGLDMIALCLARNHKSNEIKKQMYEWSTWTDCSTECIQTRMRVCPGEAVFDCNDGSYQRKDCSEVCFQVSRILIDPPIGFYL